MSGDSVYEPLKGELLVRPSMLQIEISTEKEV